ncbi:hypothetical protein [Nonomuraea typhae]|uniref:DUF2637 domain-containing protein n=1 Tax=Nonomuraea typhae TaxID=2603600 RepID=A0ABW7Z713_9ACTN
MARSTATPPAPALPPVDVQRPYSPKLERASRRWQAVRSASGRAATLAGACAAAAGLFTGELTGWALLADAALTACGLAGLRLWKPDGQQKATASVLYLIPGVSLAALLIAERMVAGIHWAEALALAVWTAGTWVVRPAEAARRMLTPSRPPAPPADMTPVPVVACDHPAARWWAQHVAVEGGAAPGTLLDEVTRTGEHSMRAVIRAGIPGQPVPDISIKRLSALMDVPEEKIDIDGVPGRGAGRRRLSIGTPDETTEDPATVWAQRIAPAAMPGAVLTGVRVGRPAAAAHTPAPQSSRQTSAAEPTTMQEDR